MKVIKLTTTTQEENINDIVEDVSVQKVLGDNETVESFTDYKVRQNYPNENLTLLYDLLRSNVLSEVPEEHLVEVLKGKSYLRKRVTTEYFIIENDGENITNRIEDDYINYLASDNPKDLSEEKQFTQVGNNILNLKEYSEGKLAANPELKQNEEKRTKS